MIGQMFCDEDGFNFTVELCLKGFMSAYCSIPKISRAFKIPVRHGICAYRGDHKVGCPGFFIIIPVWRYPKYVRRALCPPGNS